MKTLLSTSLLILALLSTGITANAQGSSPTSPPTGYPSPDHTSPPGERAQTNSSLLIKSKNFFVHGIHEPRRGYHPDRYAGSTITYTSRNTGKMHILYSSGDFDIPLHVVITESRRILGLVWDDKNIYLCVRQPSSTPVNLLVFRASDGQFIQKFSVSRDIIQTPKKDNLGSGLLRLEKDVLICFDQTFKFDKGQLIPPKVLPPKNLPTPSGAFGGFGQTPEGGFGF